MPSYAELEKLPANAYLNPSNFVTQFDGSHSKEARERKYNEALELGNSVQSIHISPRSVWSAIVDDSSKIQSYEGIGYHAITCELLRGFLDSSCEIIVYRNGQDPETIKTAVRPKLQPQPQRFVSDVRLSDCFPRCPDECEPIASNCHVLYGKRGYGVYAYVYNPTHTKGVNWHSYVWNESKRIWE